MKIEPIFEEMVDFDTFAKSDFRAVKILACEAVPKSKKLLKFTLDDGERKDRVILSGIHEYYEPEELVGKTAIAIVNLPSRKMMGMDSEGMLISAVHEEDGHEGLNLLMVMTESRQVQSCTKMRNKALRRCALASTGIRRKMNGDGKAVGFWRKMSGQFQSELPILL